MLKKKEYAIIKLHRRQGDCEVTGEVFESTASLLNKKKFLVLSNKKRNEKEKKGKKKGGGLWKGK